MLNIKKYAAIDIGSNAMRLLIANIVEQDDKETQFNKSSLVRVPIRLGQDAFTVGAISEENIEIDEPPLPSRTIYRQSKYDQINYARLLHWS